MGPRCPTTSSSTPCSHGTKITLVETKPLKATVHIEDGFFDSHACQKTIWMALEVKGSGDFKHDPGCE